VHCVCRMWTIQPAAAAADLVAVVTVMRGTLHPAECNTVVAVDQFVAIAVELSVE